MNQEKIASYKKKLEMEREKLLRELAGAETATDFGSDTDSLEEESSETEEIANKLAVGHSLRIRLDEIDTALNNIAEEKYGICTLCGKEISEKVLDVVPESQLCEQCKKTSL